MHSKCSLKNENFKLNFLDSRIMTKRILRCLFPVLDFVLKNTLEYKNPQWSEQYVLNILGCVLIRGVAIPKLKVRNKTKI